MLLCRDVSFDLFFLSFTRRYHIVKMASGGTPRKKFEEMTAEELMQKLVVSRNNTLNFVFVRLFVEVVI